MHNAAGYETALGTLSQGFTGFFLKISALTRSATPAGTQISRNGNRIIHREMPKLTELGELDYSLVISESVTNPDDDTNVPTILTFYLIDRDVGCPKQSLTFVLEVTCPEKKLLFDYG